MFKLTIWTVAVLLCLSVFMGGLFTQTCVAGQPTPCKDDEHPSEPPCNMKSCARHDGRKGNCSHWCHKGKGCCFCKKDQCSTGAPAEDQPE